MGLAKISLPSPKYFITRIFCGRNGSSPRSCRRFSRFARLTQPHSRLPRYRSISRILLKPSMMVLNRSCLYARKALCGRCDLFVPVSLVNELKNAARRMTVIRNAQDITYVGVDVHNGDFAGNLAVGSNLTPEKDQGSINFLRRQQIRVIGDKHSVIGRNDDCELIIKSLGLQPAAEILDEFVRPVAGAQVLSGIRAVRVADKIGFADIHDEEA